jgi:hypothetical protein
VPTQAVIQILDLTFLYAPAATLIYQIERRSDLLLFDFAGDDFSGSPTTPRATLPELPGTLTGLSGLANPSQSGLYQVRQSLTGLAAQYQDGDYTALIWDMALSQYVGAATITVTTLDARVVVPDTALTDGLLTRQAVALLTAFVFGERTGVEGVSAETGGVITFKSPIGAQVRVQPNYNAAGDVASVTLTLPS